MFADTILGMGRTSVLESAVDPEIEEITPDTVEECAGDPFEFLTGAYYESEMNMTHINQAVMVCEYTYLKETGNEMIFEANVVTNMFKNIGEGIKRAWKKICEFFKSIFSWLDDKIRNDQAFVTKYESTIKLINSVEIGDFSGYTFNPKNKTKMSMEDGISAVAAGQFKILETSASSLGGGRSGASADTNVEEKMNAIRGSLVGESSVSASELNDKLATCYRGEKLSQSTFSGKELKDMLAVISSTKVTKDALNVVYSSCKRYIDSLLKSAKECEKKVKKAENPGTGDSAKDWHTRATILNSLTSLSTIVNNKACKALTAHNRQCRAILAKAVSVYNKKDAERKANKAKKTPTPESASFVDSVFESFVD